MLHVSRIEAAGAAPIAFPLPAAPRSRHARRRQVERSIPDIVVEGLLAFGSAMRTRDGRAWRRVFGRRGWARFCTWLGPAARHFDRYRRVYLITSSDDDVITVAWDWR
ncbi:MAG: hypothetical protein ACK4Z0_05860 [Sphingomonadaceae bacterium]